MKKVNFIFKKGLQKRKYVLKYKRKKGDNTMNVGENLKRIRLIKSLSLKEASDLLKMSTTAISKYEKGVWKLNSEKLIKCAKAYDVKVIDLIPTEMPCELQFTAFRKKSRLTGEKLLLLKDIIRKEVSKNIEVIKFNQSNVLNIQKFNCDSLEEAEQVALKVRLEMLKISDIQPLHNMTDILENLGIVIVYIDNVNNKFSDFDGLSEIVEGIPVIVLLKQNDGARLRFTLAHEFAHLLLNINSSEEEKICDRFASSLLMPKNAIINEFGIKRNRITLKELEYFKNEYKVNYSAIIYRLQDLEILTPSSAKNLYIIVNKKYKDDDPVLIIPEISNQFKKIVYKLEASDIITIGRASELLGITIDEYLAENSYN